MEWIGIIFVGFVLVFMLVAALAPIWKDLEQ